MATTHPQEAVERVQALLSDYALSDYAGFCGLLNDLAHYAASKSWDLVDEAGIAVRIAVRREAA